MNDLPDSSLYCIAALRKPVAYFFGFGTDKDQWTTSQIEQLDETINAGYARFLVPMALPDPVSGVPRSHIWSFLKPLHTLEIIANTTMYDLPRHFAGIGGEGLSYTPNSRGSATINLVGEGRIRELIATNGSERSGAPLYAAIAPKSPSTATSQLYQLVIWPTPDSTYEITFRMVCGLFRLNDDNPIPLGGTEHWETLLESCLAVAEERRDDEAGLHSQRFQERLLASVNRDGSVMRPDSLGYMGEQGWTIQRLVPRTGTVSVNGVVYG